MREAIPYYEKAASLMEGDYHSAGMLLGCFGAIGDIEGVERAARMTLERTERVLAQDPAVGSALGFGVASLAALGDGERAKEWTKRALLMDPDNPWMRWNLACAMSRWLGDKDAAIDLLAGLTHKLSPSMVTYLRLDTDLDPLRDDPRFEALAAAAEQRVASEKAAAA
jgi:adenylate cyclase